MSSKYIRKIDKAKLKKERESFRKTLTKEQIEALDNMRIEVEPMKQMGINKRIFIIGHAIEAVYISDVDNAFWLESRSYAELTSISYQKNIYRWKFFNRFLIEKIKRYIPKNAIETVTKKDGLVVVNPDLILELPPMGGKISASPATSGDLIFYVLNPHIL